MAPTKKTTKKTKQVPVMSPESKKFLYDLLMTPSATGFEQNIQKVVEAYAKPFADTIEKDFHGNLIIGVNTKSSRRVMLAGHCDQIGLMIKHINKEGYLYFGALGGIDVGVLPGSRITIHAESGPIHGVIGRKPIHSQTSDERGKVGSDIDKLWIDIGAADKKECESLVQIGDSVTFAHNVLELRNNFVTSPGLDDKVGVFVAVETAKLCAKLKLHCAVYAVSTVQEEVGLRGAKTAAYSIDPEVGIAIDVCHATDNPGTSGANAVTCGLGKGPAISRGPNCNPVVEKLLVASAKKGKIPYQLAPSPGLLGNDANAIQVSRGGVAAGSIGIPNRYMHTQAEVCDLRDLTNSVKVLVEFMKGIGPKTDWRG